VKINIAAIKDVQGGSIPFDFSVDAQTLHEDYEALDFIGSIMVHGTATNNGLAILVQGKMCTTVQLKCNCCLEPFLLALQEEFSEEFIEGVYQENQGGQDEHEHSFFQGDEISLSELVHDHILLALPMRIVCREDCRGLCVKCGKNLNQAACNCEDDEGDPRLAVLKQLF
jgi:uncharacterized protein